MAGQDPEAYLRQKFIFTAWEREWIDILFKSDYVFLGMNYKCYLILAKDLNTPFDLHFTRKNPYLPTRFPKFSSSSFRMTFFLKSILINFLHPGPARPAPWSRRVWPISLCRPGLRPGGGLRWRGGRSRTGGPTAHTEFLSLHLAHLTDITL